SHLVVFGGQAITAVAAVTEQETAPTAVAAVGAVAAVAPQQPGVAAIAGIAFAVGGGVQAVTDQKATRTEQRWKWILDRRGQRSRRGHHRTARPEQTAAAAAFGRQQAILRAQREHALGVDQLH